MEEVQGDALSAFSQFNEQIFQVYKERDLFNLSQREFAGKNSGMYISDVCRRKINIHEIPYSDFKIHDELDFISKDLKYVTGVLYFLRPYIVDTRFTEGTYHQNLPDRRYLMYANFGLQSIYNFWDRIGDLIYLYFETGLPNEKVYLGRVLTNMKNPYAADPKSIQTDAVYLELRELYENELKPFFDERNDAVHHFQLEAQHYWGNIELRKDRPKALELNRQKHEYPEFMKRHLELFFRGYDLALRLIDRLPNRVLVFYEGDTFDEFVIDIKSVKEFEGVDLSSHFNPRDVYTLKDIAVIVAAKINVDVRLVKIFEQPK